MALGQFIESKLNKNAPLIFIAGGVDLKSPPGIYMLEFGFDKLTSFNIYNMTRMQVKTSRSEHIKNAWAECVREMDKRGIIPSKKIIVGYSLGAAYIHNVIDKNGNNWDLIISAGAYLGQYESTTRTNHIQMIKSLTNYEVDGSPISSKFVYIHAAKRNNLFNGDTQLLKIQKEFENLLPNANAIQHGDANHFHTATATSKWINANVLIQKDGSSTIKIDTTTKKRRKGNVDELNLDESIQPVGTNGYFGLNSDGYSSDPFGEASDVGVNIKAKGFNLKKKTTAGKKKGPTTSSSAKCKTTKKRPAVKKSAKAPETSGNIKKDTPPPSKNEKPEFSNSKYNHRYYISPVSTLVRENNTNENKQDVVQESSDMDLKIYLVKYESSPGGRRKPQRYIFTDIIKTTQEEAKKIIKEKTYYRVSESGVVINMKNLLSMKEIQKSQIPVKYKTPPERAYASSTSGSIINKKPKQKQFTEVSYPAKLEEMVKKNGPWYNRYWAYRLNSGPNYGFEQYETTISDKGIELISAVIPYWAPPIDDKNPKDDALVKGNWTNLIKDQIEISSPIDVPIMLNAYQVGVMNDNIGYIYESENELHMTILENEIINKGKLAIGQGLNDSNALNKVPDSAWGLYPRWSGIFAEHCLKNSGFTLQEKLGTNIDFYHRSIIQRGRLVNHPGNEVMPWETMKSLGVQNRIFKPSKIWTKPEYFNADECLESDEDSSIAIFVANYHFNDDGTLTERGKLLVNHINDVLKWPMATISTIPHHASNSTSCYAGVLLYMDTDGTLVTLSGNTDVPGTDYMVKSGNHIAAKVTNFARFAKITTITTSIDKRGAIVVARVKTGPNPGGYREKGGLANKLYTTELFKQYEGKVLFERDEITSEKINKAYYNTLLPYITNASVCISSTVVKGGPAGDDIGLTGETTEPEYLPADFTAPPGMSEVSKETCSQLQKKYKLAQGNCIPGISAVALNKKIDVQDCKGGLTAIHVANLMAFIAAKESSNRYFVTNRFGYHGRYQFGSAALEDVGFLTRNGSASNPKSWRGPLSIKFGINSAKDYKNCPIAQEYGMQVWIEKIFTSLEKHLKNYPCDKVSQYIAAAHIAGPNAVKRWIEKGIEPAPDGNNVPTPVYARMGFDAANSIFTTNDRILKDAYPLICKSDKYFLYPGPCSNGLGLMRSDNIQRENPNSNPNPRPQPVNGNIEISPGEFFVKINPAKVSLITIPRFGPSNLIGKEKYSPEEFIEVANDPVGGVNASWFENSLDNKFGVYYLPPLKNEAITDVERGGIPAYKRTPSAYDCGYYVVIDNNDKLLISDKKFQPIPETAKYAFSTKWLATDSNGKNIAISSGARIGRGAIGNLDDGNIFVWVTYKNYTLKQAASQIAKIPGVKNSAFLDAGNSSQLYYRNWGTPPKDSKYQKQDFPVRVNKGRKFPSYLVWYD